MRLNVFFYKYITFLSHVMINYESNRFLKKRENPVIPKIRNRNSSAGPGTATKIRNSPEPERVYFRKKNNAKTRNNSGTKNTKKRNLDF